MLTVSIQGSELVQQWSTVGEVCLDSSLVELLFTIIVLQRQDANKVLRRFSSYPEIITLFKSCSPDLRSNPSLRRKAYLSVPPLL